MRNKKIWIAVSMAAIMSAVSFSGTMVLAEEQTTAVEEQTDAEVEASETESLDAVVEETESVETEAAETEISESEEDEIELVAVSYQEENAWDQVAITNSEYVSSGLNIRSEADTESKVLGYLYLGTAVWVLDRGDTWTQLYSNGITGYVMSEYLLYGDDVAEIAEIYGVEGVRAAWDGVNVYTADDGATVKATMDAGDVFQVVNDYGHWIEVQYDEETTAFVSSEDVVNVMLFESATPKDGERVQLVKFYETDYETYYEEETSEDTSEDTYSETYVSETDVTEAADTYTSYTDTSTSTSGTTQTETTASTETTYTETTTTEAASTEAASTETATTEAASTEAASTETTTTEATTTETTTTETSSSSSSDGGYYDADTDTYYDENGNAVTTSYEAETTVSTEAETTASTEAETTVAEESVSAAAETEAVSTSDSTDSTSLLAALIYCEAGNQSYEGMVAVGAVVMNRVSSASFPNTISEVIYQSGQFTPASSGALASAIANGVPSTCYTAAAAAIAGEDPTGGALYFNTSAGTGIQIGDHWFY